MKTVSSTVKLWLVSQVKVASPFRMPTWYVLASIFFTARVVPSTDGAPDWVSAKLLKPAMKAPVVLAGSALSLRLSE